MNKATGIWRCHGQFLLFLAILLSAYAFYFLSFTVFDGFATISNDSFNYILLARKWSPYFDPSLAEALTWPALAYPPGFPWLLAIFGASESNLGGHLMVALAMLASIATLGWYTYCRIGLFAGALITVCIALLPGVVISSLGILSENPYLLFTILVLIFGTAIKGGADHSPSIWLALGVFLIGALLTRTIGIALVGAFLAVAVLDRKIPRNQRIGYALVVLVSLVAWQLWSAIDPQGKESTYVSFLTSAFGNESSPLVDRATYYFGFVYANAVGLIVAWNHYFTLSLPNDLFFWYSLLLLVACLTTTALRAVRLKLDALYVSFYLAITLAWPYPEELVRYIHPIVPLMLIQPVIYAFELRESRFGGLLRPAAMAMIFVVLADSVFVQIHLYSLQNSARSTKPALKNSLEYYSLPDRREAEYKAIVFQDALRLMASTTEIVPIGSTVAAAQHTPYAIMADRPAVIHSAVVPYPQQLCNFKLANVEYLFLSTVIDSFNPYGIGQVDRYREIAAEVWSLKESEGRPGAFVLRLDQSKIMSELLKSGHQCDAMRVVPGR